VTTARFELLGPFRVRYGGREIPVGRATAQAVLVALVLRPNVVLARDQLVRAVWGSVDGASGDSLYHYVSALRKALAPTGTVIESRRPGYRIGLDPAQVDALAFDEVATAAARLRGAEPMEAARLLREALTLWQGPAALPGLDLPGTRDVATSLDGRRLTAEEDLAALDLAAGRAAEVADRLFQLHGAHPGRDRLTALLVRALAATGRNDEAVALAGPVTGRDGPLAAAVRAARGECDDGVATFGVPARPSQLPPPTAHPVGRTTELRQITDYATKAASAQAPAICAIAGMAGVGKTELAIRAGYELADRFADGALFVDLRGFTPASSAMTPEVALDVLLRGLGIAGALIPPGTDARAALYRSVLADRRLLVVLDNAAGEEQVQPLLPGAGSCMVLITSRRRLAGLDDAEHVLLDVLDTGPAITLFTRVAGDRAGETDTPAREELITLCGHLPLAIRIAAARLRITPALRPAALLTELRRQDTRLAELSDGHRGVAAALAVSYDHLGPDRRQDLRRLALHPGADLALPAAASLFDRDLADTRWALAELEAASLLGQPAPERFQLHDLIREYAVAAGARSDLEPDRQAAYGRLLDHYLHAADLASRLLMPHRLRFPLDGAACNPPKLTSRSDALAWLDGEHRNLVAVSRIDHSDFDARRWQLAYTMRDYFYLRKQLDSWLLTHELALAGALRAGDRHAEARTRNNLGRVLLELGRTGAALIEYDLACELFESLGDEHGRSNALANLATLHRREGRHELALANLETARTYYRRAGARRNTGITLRSMARVETELGRLDAAAEHARQALDQATELALDLDAAQALAALGLALERAGNPTAAAAAYQRATEHARAGDSAYEQARALRRLGGLAAAAGDVTTARHQWTQALTLLRPLAVPAAQEVAADLAALDHLRPDL
jgi:DNA-binding SARP family transcriptional activator/tetratricopeptide (TPR) repeat protein